MRVKEFTLILLVLCFSWTWGSNTFDDPKGDHLDEIIVDSVDSAGAALEPGDDLTVSSDSAYAVDDEIWRQLRLAGECFAQGVAANQEAAWEEAQYYLERALTILADLDIDPEADSPEAKKYNTLLNEIVADYRLTLLSMGSLPEDASPSAFLEMFAGMPRAEKDTLLRVKGEEKPVTYNVPIVFNDKVKKSIVYFQTVAREAFERYLQRSGRYIPLMLEIFQQHNLPSDLVYLPLIESGFNCKAYSWARASGPWQFIASTGRLYGLQRNWWYDERRDFVKSTHAAARFLKELYEKFGSWELALAAYNGGPGRISRTIERQRTTDFWEMDLRKQTEDYVPFYMAATIIAKNPELYGFNVDYDDPLEFDLVNVDKCLSLKTVAEAVGTSQGHIQELNPELLRDVTPPQDGNYQLRIPKGMQQKFAERLPDLKSPKETNWVRHEIRRGETISSIANRYGVSQYAILEANNMTARTKIYTGRALIVPVPLDGRKASSGRPSERRVTGENTYVVQKGDNLSEIARDFGTSPETLRRLNYLGNSSRIYVGQVIKLPGSSKGKAVENSRGYDSAPAEQSHTYVVKQGDTVWGIAQKYGTSTATIRRLNGLSRTSPIHIGQRLLLPGSEGGAVEYLTYTVRKGDTLDRIARAFGTSIRALMRLNNLDNANRLMVGTKLKIAKKQGES